MTSFPDDDMIAAVFGKVPEHSSEKRMRLPARCERPTHSSAFISRRIVFFLFLSALSSPTHMFEKETGRTERRKSTSKWRPSLTVPLSQHRKLDQEMKGVTS